MRLSRLRPAELLAGAGAVALLVLMFLDWFGLPSDPGPRATRTAHGISYAVGFVDDAMLKLDAAGWTSLGWFPAALIALAIAACLGWMFVTVTHDSPAVPLAGTIGTFAAGLFATIAILARLVFQPGLGVGLPNVIVEVRWPAYAGLAAAVAIVLGAWLAVRDERIGQAPSSAPEVELRPIPPPAA
jgi:hypothetical protein